MGVAVRSGSGVRVVRGFGLGFGRGVRVGAASGKEVAAGASDSPASSGSDEMPTRWEVRLVAAVVTPTATRRPPRASAVQSRRRRIMASVARAG